MKLHLLFISFVCFLATLPLAADDLVKSFASPPDSARPGVYWYFMDGNLSREGMTRDLESMKEAGIGHLVFLEVNVGVPRGPVDFLSEEWQELFAHAAREADRLGIEITLGSGPGWTGSGGPWVRPAQSMQHLVGSKLEVCGPGKFHQKLAVPPPHRPFFGDVPARMRAEWESFYKDVAVLAFPTPTSSATIPDLEEKAIVHRAPFTSQPGVKPRLEAPAEFPSDPPGAAVPMEKVIDLTSRLQTDGTLDWEIPAGNWTVMRFVSRNNGASTRPAPEPGIGFECDKFDARALDAHFEEYVAKLLKRVGKRRPDRGWTMLHIDSWEMGAQNWTPRLREEFRKRRGYDPQPFYPAIAGQVVGSREQTERFLWDLRLTGQDLVIENHAEHLKKLGRKHGFGLSIEPYDMTPVNDFDLGAVADVPMCEFWSIGFNSSFSCHEASSIAHVMGRPIVAAEAFTGGPGEDWRFYPGSLKDQGDWAFATGINRFTYHTFAHKPDETRPGMVMGPYGVHWDRGQTWWPMVADYHRYISRCSQMLRQGRTVADVLYLMPEGAPNVFQPPPSVLAGSTTLPDRRGYNFDACSAPVLLRHAKVRSGRIAFPGGAEYRLLVLPDVETMTPELANKLESLAKAGATIVGNPPRKSPSLVKYPECDRQVARTAATIWGEQEPTSSSIRSRKLGKGHIVFGDPLRPSAEAAQPSPLLQSKWIWFPEGQPTRSAPVGKVRFTRRVVLPANRSLASAHFEATADNSFTALINGTEVLRGYNFNESFAADVTECFKSSTNVMDIIAENGGASPNPAGLIAALQLRFTDGSTQLITTDPEWTASVEAQPGAAKAAIMLGEAAMEPWKLCIQPGPRPIYPHYGITADLLRDSGIPEDFACAARVRYTHRRTAEREIYFVANASNQPLETTARFRVTEGAPELWHPVSGGVSRIKDFQRATRVTSIPLRFEPYESYFIVFPRKNGAVAAPRQGPAAFPTGTTVVQVVTGPWEVSFDPSLGGPAKAQFEKLQDWTERPEPGIRHYSGIATYQTSFSFKDTPGAESLWLDVGTVNIMARVRVNGKDCGTVWTAPWHVNVNKAIKKGQNTLEVEVANLWPNRMIGDAASKDKKITQTTYHPYKAGDPLLPSGLLGPVRVLKREH